jgi:hypothetical protein
MTTAELQKATGTTIPFAKPADFGVNLPCRQCGAADGTTVHFDIRRGKQTTSETLCRACATDEISRLISYPDSDELLSFFRIFHWGEKPPMTFDERTALMKSITPEQLGQERNFRYSVLLLLADIASSLATSAYSHREQLKILQARAQKPGPAAPGPVSPPIKGGARR